MGFVGTKLDWLVHQSKLLCIKETKLFYFKNWIRLVVGPSSETQGQLVGLGWSKPSKIADFAKVFKDSGKRASIRRAVWKWSDLVPRSSSLLSWKAGLLLSIPTYCLWDVTGPSCKVLVQQYSWLAGSTCKCRIGREVHIDCFGFQINNVGSL